VKRRITSRDFIIFIVQSVWDIGRFSRFLLVDGFCSGLNREFKGLALFIAFNRKFHTATFIRLWGPSGLPEMVGGAVGRNNRDFGNTDFT
jgi:hypothetical protein